MTISAMLGVGAKEYYAARNASGSTDLFVTDGTALGTSKLASFAGTAANTPVANMTSVGSQAYFTVDEGTNGLALWKTDGTAGGTVKVKDVPPQGGQGASTWLPYSLTAVGDRLYFIANDGLTGVEVWTSDGTTDGTVALDTSPGTPGQGLNPTTGTLIGVGSTLYVSTYAQLYKYDGTTAAPVPVAGAPGAVSGSLATIGTKLFYSSAGQFYAYDTATNSLGTLGVPAAQNTYGETVVGSKVFFFTTTGDTGVGTRLWSSDGTAAGTSPIKTIPASVSNYNATGVAAGGNFVFSLDDGAGWALWKSDGTAGGTAALTSGGNRITNPSFLAATGTRVYYVRPGGTGPALWMTETAAGGASSQLLDMTPFAGGGSVRMLSASGGSAYAAFSQTTDGVGRLVKSDGTIGGSGVFREFTPAATLDSNPRSSVTLGSGPVLFLANDLSGADGLWASNGTAGGTTLLQSFGTRGIVASAPLTLFNGRAYFLVKQTNYASTNEGLWTSDGTSAALAVSIDGLQGSDSIVVFNGSLYFNTAPNGALQPTQLRKSDGSAGGTSIVQTFATSVTDLVDGGTRLFMTVNDGSLIDPSQLWSLAAGGNAATPVLDGGGQPLLYPSRVTMVGQTPFVVAGSTGSRQLYRINLATGVASAVTDTGSNPVTFGNVPYLAAMGSTLVFNALSGGSPVLWAVGTTGQASPVMLGGQPVANPGQPVTLGANTYFAADGANGRELYKYNGTAASLVRDINVGAGGSNPTNLTVVGSTLVFLANNGVNGVEPWISDGTAAGTVLAADITPGSVGSITGLGSLVLGQTNGRLLLALSDGSRGVEPWSMVLNSPTNTAPTLDPIANQVVLVNQTLTFRAVGSDIDAGQTLTYSLVNAPSGAQIDSISGVVTWAPTTGNSYTLTVQVTDSGSPPASASRVVNITVNSPTTPPPAQSTTTLGLSATSIAFGQSVTFTATIGNAGADPGGSVTFTSGGTVLATVLVSGTSASYTTNTLASGSYAIQATYSGNLALGSSSNVVNLGVGAGTTATALGVSAPSITADQSVTLTANVTSPSGTPTGNVSFFNNGTLLGTVALANGAASLPVGGLSIGNATFTATYAATVNWAASASGSQAVSVTAIPTTIAIFAPSTVATAGESVTLTAHVDSSSGKPTGTVTFFINGGNQVTAALTDGIAVATFNGLPIGTYSFTAQYAAAGNWAAAATPTAQAQVVTVQALPTSTSLAVSAASVTAGQPVTLTATVGSNAGAPSGNVTFFRNGASLGTVALSGGVAILTLSNLPVGTGTITAQYAAAGNWASSTSAAQSVAVAELPTSVLAGTTGIAVKAKGNGVATITLKTSRALNKASALKATNYTLYVGRKVRIKGKTTILYDKPIRPKVKYTAGGTTITLTPPGGRLAIPNGVNAKLVVKGLVDAQNKAVTTYAVFFGKRGLVGVTTASTVRVLARSATLKRS